MSAFLVLGTHKIGCKIQAKFNEKTLKRLKTKRKRGQEWSDLKSPPSFLNPGLLLFIFVLFNNNFTLKLLTTRIVRVEGEHTDHLTGRTAKSPDFLLTSLGNSGCSDARHRGRDGDGDDLSNGEGHTSDLRNEDGRDGLVQRGAVHVDRGADGEDESESFSLLAVRPDKAIYSTLGNFLNPLETIILTKSSTFLGNFCKSVNIIHFLVKSFLGNF